MNTRDKFLKKDILRIDNGDLSEDESHSRLKNKIIDIRSNMNSSDNKKNINLNSTELDLIIEYYSIGEQSKENRELIKEIINNTNYDSSMNYPVIFNHNLLIIDLKILNEYLNKENNEDVLRELTQLLVLIKLEKNNSLKEIVNIRTMPFGYTNSFIDSLKFEEQIIKKINKSMSFRNLIDYISTLENDIKVFKNEREIYEKTIEEIEKIVLFSPEKDNLIEFKDEKICFNIHSLNTISTLELSNNNKRELIQSLSLIISKNEEDTNNYSKTLFKQKEKIIALIERKVSEQDINKAIECMPEKFELDTIDLLKNILKVKENDRFIVFENSFINLLNLDNLMTLNYKKDQIITYFMIQCFNANKEIDCRLLNNKNIKFKEFERVYYIEDLLKNKLKEYSLNDILKVIHEFKKDKIFNKENENIIDNVISENFVKNFSHNQNNKEILFINSSRCIFNEKLMSKINELPENQLTQIYLLTNDKLREELSKNIILDKWLSNIKNYETLLRDKIKYKITEKDILDALEKIEEQSNTLISSKNKIFQEASIVLNAKEVKEISNDIVEFSYRNQELYLYSFNKGICDKLLKKELIDLSKREFVQALLLSEIKDKNIIIKNSEGNEIKIHDNFIEIEKYKDTIIDKIYYQVTEEEIDKAFKIITDQFESSSKENIQYTINNIKKKCGIKVKSTFKHIL